MKRAILTVAALLSTTVLITVAGPSTGMAEIVPGADALWSLKTIPGTVNWPDEQPVELGVRFTASEPVDIVGIRYYKGDMNIGEHIGTLWASDGTMIATGTFVGETADGWQDLLFDSRVAIVPGAVYIASYFVPIGYYSADNEYFSAGGVTEGPITALGGTDANGVYHYGSTEFPTFSYRQSNYWVTPLWSTNVGPEVDVGADASGVEGEAISLAGTATDGDGDPLTTTWQVTTGPDDGGSCVIAGASSLSTTVTCDDDGTVEVRLTADDGVNPPVSDTMTVTLTNAEPTITSTVGTGAPVALNTSVSLSSTINDAGLNDTHTCSIAWGDGAYTAAACSGEHSYSAAGVYDVLVTVSDDDGGTASYDAVVVVFDPSAGFVTGGGWIHSPAGAYAADPSATGKASLGFVSKYKKGANVPTGNTTFQFSTAGFEFKSDSYDWMVVSGTDKAQFKGSGSINGTGSHKFMISVSDGASDTFRIRIWDETSSGELVIYDNGVDTTLGGGQVVIHVVKKR